MGRPCSRSSAGTSAPDTPAHHNRSPRPLDGSSRTSRTPSGSPHLRPLRATRTRAWWPFPSGSRSSTAHRPSSPRVEKCTTTRVCPIHPSTAAASVGDVFTTSRSPARSNRGNSANT